MTDFATSYSEEFNTFLDSPPLYYPTHGWIFLYNLYSFETSDALPDPVPLLPPFGSGAAIKMPSILSRGLPMIAVLQFSSYGLAF